MWKLQELIECAESTDAEIDGEWVPARPMSLSGFAGFRERVKDAFSVFTGKAEAFKWPKGQ